MNLTPSTRSLQNVRHWIVGKLGNWRINNRVRRYNKELDYPRGMHPSELTSRLTLVLLSNFWRIIIPQGWSPGRGLTGNNRRNDDNETEKQSQHLYRPTTKWYIFYALVSKIQITGIVCSTIMTISDSSPRWFNIVTIMRITVLWVPLVCVTNGFVHWAGHK